MVKAFIILMAVVVLGTAGHILMKYGFMQNDDYDGPTFSMEGINRIVTNPYLMAGIIIVGANFLLWVAALRIFELGYASFMISIEYVLLLFGSYLFLRETVTVPKIIGVVLIIAGIVFLNWGESAVLKRNLEKGAPPLIMDKKQRP